MIHTHTSIDRQRHAHTYSCNWSPKPVKQAALRELRRKLPLNEVEHIVSSAAAEVEAEAATAAASVNVSCSAAAV